ncbi:MAG: hypothetical protein AABO58_18040 [Acidobacteriota bacterium]
MTDINDAIRHEYSRLLRKREQGETLTDSEQKTMDAYEYGRQHVAALFGVEDERDGSGDKF